MTSQIGKTFGTFVGTERDLYEGDDNNKVAFSLLQVGRYLDYVDIIHSRYAEVGEAYARSTQCRLDDAKKRPGTRKLKRSEYDQYLEDVKLSNQLHLDIESFLIFSKMALDKIANFIEDYFGSVRSASLKSHNNWCKKASDFVRHHGIQLPGEMLATADLLRCDVGEYRDKQLTHRRNPRTVFGTFTTVGGDQQIATIHLYPRDKDVEVESPQIGDVVAKLDTYVKQLMELIVSNRDKSRYQVLSGYEAVAP